MLLLTALAPQGPTAQVTQELSLSFDQRRRARLRTTLTDGTPVGLMLDRGLALKEGDVLRSDDGTLLVRVRAAGEHLSRVSTDDPHLLTRAAYHLGNRHVALQVAPGQLCYPHDHVLDGMCRELGLAVEQIIAPFEPEHGGYGHGHGDHALVRRNGHG
jgi:urease accessory protein